MKIVGIVGNNSKKSSNRVLLEYMADRYGKDVDFEVHGIEDIPLFNVDNAGDVPESVKKLNDAIEAADGVVFSTAEYDHSITAALKSAIEWLSSVYHPFTDKPVMIVGASYGTLGSVRAQMNLRTILNAPGLQAKVLQGNEFLLGQAKEKFDDEGKMTDTGTADFLDLCFNNFKKFVEDNNLAVANRNQETEVQ